MCDGLRKDHWRFISRDCCLSEEEFIKAIQFVLDSTFFVVDSVIYRQHYGIPMGSPFPIIVDLIMRELKVRVLIRFPFPFTRSVNDILLVAPASSVNSILDIFNS